MPSIALARTDVIIGVDTHKDQHVAVAIDGLGGRLAEQFVAATTAGYAQLQAWARDLGRVVAFGVEGTGSYGIGLTRFLRRGGHTVFEVHRPPRKVERRLQGKSDTVDAEHAARQVLAGTATAAAVVVAVIAVALVVVAAGPAGAQPAAPELDDVIDGFRRWLVGLLAGLATLFLTIGGLRYLSAGGDPGQIERAKSALRSGGLYESWPSASVLPTVDPRPLGVVDP